MTLIHMTLIGVWHIAILWLGMVVLNAARAEPFIWPSQRQWGLLCASAAIAFVVNAVTMIGLVFTSPLFISVGVDMVIPASWVADRIAHPNQVSSVLCQGIVTNSCLQIARYSACNCWNLCCDGWICRPQRCSVRSCQIFQRKMRIYTTAAFQKTESASGTTG